MSENVTSVQQVSDAMEAAEEALIKTGFPEDQWLLIRDYITNALVRSHLLVVKEWENHTPLSIEDLDL